MIKCLENHGSDLNFILDQLESLRDFQPRYHNQIYTIRSHSGHSVEYRP